MTSQLFSHCCVILSLIVGLGGSAMYIWDTLNGSTHPNRVSWFMWTLAPTIGLFTALAAHADPWSVVIIFLSALICGLIFVASLINRTSYYALDRWDAICGLCSLIALVFWLYFHTPLLGLALAIAGDAFAAVPTIRKALKNPETETGLTYITGFIAVILNIPATAHWDLPNFGFTAYLFLINGLLIWACFGHKLRT